MNNKVLLIYGKTNEHLGLWNDLRGDSRVILRSTLEKSIPVLTRLYFAICRRIGRFPFKYLFYHYSDYKNIVKKVSYLILIDGSLNVVKISELNKCRKINPNLKIYLYLINSIDAKSPIMNRVRPKINMFNWDGVLTFDQKDAEKYGFLHLGFCYYSEHFFQKESKNIYDAYYIGGLKGGRNETIYDVYFFFMSHNVNCNFNLMPIGEFEIRQIPGINYLQGWCPYENILSHVQQTNCIIEIMQVGQSGATLRYFEAVCMNKKLLTNNKQIVNFPFYNPRWMRVFHNVEDIDINWVRKREEVDYGYAGEFSPVHLIDYILSNTNDDEI